jgi:hypothetical protein
MNQPDEPKQKKQGGAAFTMLQDNINCVKTNQIPILKKVSYLACSAVCLGSTLMGLFMGWACSRFPELPYLPHLLLVFVVPMFVVFKNNMSMAMNSISASSIMYALSSKSKSFANTVKADTGENRVVH